MAKNYGELWGQLKLLLEFNGAIVETLDDYSQRIYSLEQNLERMTVTARSADQRCSQLQLRLTELIRQLNGKE